MEKNTPTMPHDFSHIYYIPLMRTPQNGTFIWETTILGVLARDMPWASSSSCPGREVSFSGEKDPSSKVRSGPGGS